MCAVGDVVGWGHFSRSTALARHLNDSSQYTTVLLIQAENSRVIRDLSASESLFWATSISHLLARAESYLSEDVVRVIVDHPTLSDDAMNHLADRFGPLLIFFSNRRNNLAPRMVHKLIVPRLDLPQAVELPASKIALGTRFTPLRLNFYRQNTDGGALDQSNLSGLFICMGGGNQVLKITRALEELMFLDYAKPIVIVVSKSSAKLTSLVNKTDFPVRLITNPSEIEIVQLIDRADMGWVSAGTIAQECFSRGLVCGVSEVAEDQMGLSHAFERRGLAIAVDMNQRDSIMKLISITADKRRFIENNLKSLDYHGGINELLSFVR